MSDEIYEVVTPAPVMPGLRVAILGTGKMGGILLQAFLKNNLVSPDQIFATVHHPDRAQALSAQFGVEVTTDNLAAAQQADVILLGVKPIQVPGVIEQIKSALSPDKLVLSFAASVMPQATILASSVPCRTHRPCWLPESPRSAADALSQKSRWPSRSVSSRPSDALWSSTKSTWTPSPGSPAQARRFCTSSSRHLQRRASMSVCPATSLHCWPPRQRSARQEWCSKRDT